MRNKKLLVSIIEGAIMVGLTVVLDLIFKQIPILKMPSGGSVSIKLVPLLVYSLRRGPLYGTLASVVYGIVAFLIDGYSFEPFSFFLDYIFAFGAMGIAGFFAKAGKKHIIFIIVGCMVATCARFVFSTISGMLYYLGEPLFEALIASVVYNAPYIFISGILCTIITCLLKKIIYIEFNN